MPSDKSAEFSELLTEVRRCSICTDLPLGPLPLLQAHPDATLLIAGQAPGRKTHEIGIPFDDASGNRLREWLGITREQFYDARKLAILPMGFCYPGTGKNGDLPPRPECAPAWREKLLEQLPNIQLTLIIGQYALEHHLGKRRKKNLTETVKAWQEYLPRYLPLPHPSPRNNIWLRKNPWFMKDVIPYLQSIVKENI